jgi:hypothetical protein
MAFVWTTTNRVWWLDLTRHVTVFVPRGYLNRTSRDQAFDAGPVRSRLGGLEMYFVAGLEPHPDNDRKSRRRD